VDVDSVVTYGIEEVQAGAGHIAMLGVLQNDRPLEAYIWRILTRRHKVQLNDTGHNDGPHAFT
jgi:hypothetical protein